MQLYRWKVVLKYNLRHSILEDVPPVCLATSLVTFVGLVPVTPKLPGHFDIETLLLTVILSVLLFMKTTSVRKVFDSLAVSDG